MTTHAFTCTGPYAILIMLGIKRVENRSALSVPAKGRYRRSTDVWDEGLAYWWDLSNVVCFERPIPCRGNVGMWQMPSDLADRVAAADQLAQNVGVKIATAADAERLFRRMLPITGGREGFFVLPLDAECRTLSEPVLVSLGDPTTTVIQPGEVFAVAFRTGAASVVLAHNHPSGDPTPSLQDRQLTDALVGIGGRLGIRIVDHLVIGATEFKSIQDTKE